MERLFEDLCDFFAVVFALIVGAVGLTFFVGVVVMAFIIRNIFWILLIIGLLVIFT